MTAVTAVNRRERARRANPSNARTPSAGSGMMIACPVVNFARIKSG